MPAQTTSLRWAGCSVAHDPVPRQGPAGKSAAGDTLFVRTTVDPAYLPHERELHIGTKP